MSENADIAAVTTSVYSALAPLDSEMRFRALQAVVALLGESFELHKEGGVKQQQGSVPASVDLGDDFRELGRGLGENAARWMKQNRLERQMLDQLFHINGEVELIVPDVIGASKKEKTANCYLLVGIRSLIERDQATFDDREAIAFCHQTNAYDKNNHTVNRKALGNRMSGDRASGLTLTVPGLRDAAKLIKQMAETNP